MLKKECKILGTQVQMHTGMCIRTARVELIRVFDFEQVFYFVTRS